MTTLELLTAYKAHHGGVTDYRAAKLLGIRSQTVYNWKTGTTMADDTAIRIAEELGLDPVTVLLDLHIEREKGNAASQVWKAARDRLRMAATPVVVGLVGYAGGALVGVPLI